jgi:hypothetical protein
VAGLPHRAAPNATTATDSWAHRIWLSVTTWSTSIAQTNASASAGSR